MIITIDGPTASGKTTLARMLAKKLSFYYLSSGLLFRGLAYALVYELGYQEEQLYNPRKEDIDRILYLNKFKYSYDAEQQEQLYFDGKNITDLLRNKKISHYASVIGTNSLVRNALAVLQHNIAEHHDVVVEGRDTGSVIFPHADVKFYLTASFEVRAQRWAQDQAAKGRIISLDVAQEEVTLRDERDSTRALAPLCIPERAIIIDDSELTKEEVLARMEEEIKKAAF